MKRKIHTSVTLDRIMDGMKRTAFGMENVGFCLACGEESDSCEPDARCYPCESCGEPRSVFGAEEVLLMVQR